MPLPWLRGYLFSGVFSVSHNARGVILCFRNIFSVGKIVTDAQLTMYLVLLPSMYLHYNLPLTDSD